MPVWYLLVIYHHTALTLIIDVLDNYDDDYDE